MRSTIDAHPHRIVRLFVVAALMLVAAGLGALAPAARAADTTSVTIRLHGCPDGFDGINANIYDFAQQCHTPLGGVPISIQFGNLAPTQQTDIDGNWSFTDIPVGTVTITEFPPVQGWLIRAFCSQFDTSGAPSNYLEAPAGQGSASWNLTTGQALDCDWYNFPFVAPTSTTVSLHLHGCPEGFDGVNASIYDLAQYCQTPLGGVDFAVQYSNLAPAHQTDLDGNWTFTDVTTGPLTVTEIPPVQGWLIRAFCAQFNVNTGPNGYQEVPAGQGSVSFTLLANQALDCEWYNFPAVTPTTATVMIRTHGCPPGEDISGKTIYELAADCQGLSAGLAFTLTTSANATLNGTTGADGSVTWQTVPSGKTKIQQALTSDINGLRIFCNQRKLAGDEIGFNEETAAPDGTITVQLLAGYDEYDCDWFNGASGSNVSGTPAASPVASPGATPVTVPTPSGNGGTGGTGGSGGNGGGITPTNGNGSQSNGGVTGPTSLTIVVFVCPKGYDVFDTEADPATDCHDTAKNTEVSSLGGVTGTLTTKTTNAQGTVQFKGLKSGNHLITVRPNAPLASAFILACTSNLVDLSTSPFYPLTQVDPTKGVWIDVQPGEQLSCGWYDVLK